MKGMTPDELRAAVAEDTILSAAAAIHNARRASKRGGRNGGRPARPTPCARCGVECDSAAVARKHCAGAKQRAAYLEAPTPCPQCDVVCPSVKAAWNDLRDARAELVELRKERGQGARGKGSLDCDPQADDEAALRAELAALRAERQMIAEALRAVVDATAERYPCDLRFEHPALRAARKALRAVKAKP